MNDDMQKQIKKHFRQMDTLFQPYQLDSFLRTPDDALEDTFFEFTTPVIYHCLIRDPYLLYLFVQQGWHALDCMAWCLLRCYHAYKQP